MISGAEAARIPRALASVAGWVAEIIVVLNQEVNDGTEKLALQHGARVIREPWKGHIAQKNSAASKSGQPWILGLDADEVVSDALRTEIADLFDAPRPGGHAAYSFPRCSMYCGRWIRHGDWYPDRQTRLWRRGSASWGGIDPHDKLIVQGTVGRLRNDLLHYTAVDMDSQIAKISLYSADFARHAVKHHRNATLFDLAARPLWRFLRAYFLRLGFLDGWQGYHLAWLIAFASVTRYAKVRLAVQTRQAADGKPG